MPRPRIEIQPLPIYDSLKQCSAATGIPLTILKDAKAAGCPAFKSNRIYLEDLLRWIFGRKSDDSSVDWGKALKKEQTLVTRAKRMGLQDKIADKEETVLGLHAIEAHLFSSLDQIFGFELPAAVKGMSEQQVRAKATEEIERLKTQLRDKFTSLRGKSKDVSLEYANTGLAV